MLQKPVSVPVINQTQMFYVETTECVVSTLSCLIKANPGEQQFSLCVNEETYLDYQIVISSLANNLFSFLLSFARAHTFY